MKGGDNTEINIHSISKALTTVGYLKGVESFRHDICISSGTMDSFLLMVVMAELIESGSLEIKYNPDGSSKPNRLNYFKELCEGIDQIKEGESK